MSGYGGGFNSPRGGGGFLNDTQSPFSGSQSPGGGSGGSRDSSGSTTRSLTIAQIQKATQTHPEAPWVVEGKPVEVVTVVAHVFNIERHPTNCIYQIDDSTGKMEVRHWWDESSSADDMKWADIREGTFVRVSGMIKVFGAKRFINAKRIRPCSDGHEVFYHMLDVVTTTLILEQGGVLPHANGTSAPSHTSGQAQSTSNNMSAYSAQSYVKQEASDPAFAHLSAIELQIVHFLRDNATTDGVHVVQIARGINGFNAEEISGALETLMDAGHVYTTVDDSHFCLST